jgi:hypothetical protein
MTAWTTGAIETLRQSRGQSLMLVCKIRVRECRSAGVRLCWFVRIWTRSAVRFEGARIGVHQGGKARWLHSVNPSDGALQFQDTLPVGSLARVFRLIVALILPAIFSFFVLFTVRGVRWKILIVHGKIDVADRRSKRTKSIFGLTRAVSFFLSLDRSFAVGPSLNPRRQSCGDLFRPSSRH